MKKRALSILLTLCLVLMLIPVTTLAEETGSLAITVNGFEVGRTPNDITFAMESAVPGITFSENDIRYVAWMELVDSDWEPFGNTKVFKADTSYRCVVALDNKGLNTVPAVTMNGKTMEYCEFGIKDGVPIQLEMYTNLGTPKSPPLLAVTVNGFEAGKALNDCTFSFESTNIGVTFSEDDINGSVKWYSYRYNGTRYGWFVLPDSAVFEAGTQYTIGFTLDNKGLEQAPPTTVNGKTPGACEIIYYSGLPYAISITCELGLPAIPPLTISGPDVVCAEQDYDFTVTPPVGVTLDKVFVYDTGAGKANLTIDEKGVGHGVVSAEEYDPQTNDFTLTVQGTAPGDDTVFGSKTVKVSPEHIYADGVCGCGAEQTYTITYDDGDGSDPLTAVKTHGKALTLRGVTFTMDGFVQTGWVDEQGALYDLGGTYTEDQDLTLSPVFDKLITVTVPFTTTVALGDAGEPGETTFVLGLIDGAGNELTFDDQSFGAEITTDGVGSYSGTMTITATEKWLYDMLYEGAFIRQYDGEEDGWSYDDTVWGVRLYMPEVGARSSSDAAYSLLLYPAYLTDEGFFNLNLNAGTVARMTFTNTYTGHAYVLDHDADGHWETCAGCKAKRNEEPHRYGDWKVIREATTTEAGEKEHTCTVCGYTEKAEIEKLPATAEPANPATKPGTASSATGDNSHMALWLALLFVSGAGVIGTIVYGRKKRAK